MVDESERSLSTRVEARRSQRVMLRIPILVRAEIKGEPPLEEDTFTMVVNAHGALIALAMKVRPGQKLDLRNWGTAKEQACRVVHVKNNPFGRNEVWIEFPFPNPHFWNLDFPPLDWKPFLDRIVSGLPGTVNGKGGPIESCPIMESEFRQVPSNRLQLPDRIALKWNICLQLNTQPSIRRMIRCLGLRGVPFRTDCCTAFWLNGHGISRPKKSHLINPWDLGVVQDCNESKKLSSRAGR